MCMLNLFDACLLCLLLWCVTGWWLLVDWFNFMFGYRMWLVVYHIFGVLLACLS